MDSCLNRSIEHVVAAQGTVKVAMIVAGALLEVILLVVVAFAVEQ